MSTVLVKRLPRRPEPAWPSGELVLTSPPELPGEGRRNWIRMIMILPMLAGGGGMAMMYARFGGGGGGVLAYLPGALMGVAMLGMAGVMFTQQAAGKGKKQMFQERRRYLRQLSQQRRQAQKTVATQRRSAWYRHPDPVTLWNLPPSARLWERRRGDADFAQLRIGLGPQELATPISPPDTKPLEDLEPMCALALRRFLTTYAVVPDLPIVMALNGFSAIYLHGDAERTRALVRALLAQVATLHAPEDLLVAVGAADEQRAAWEWLKWLPHALHPTKTDALGPRRLVADSVVALEATLEDIVASRPRFNPAAAHAQSGGPHLLVVLDRAEAAGADHLTTEVGVDGVTIIAIDGTPPRVLSPAQLVLHVAADGTLSSTTYEGKEPIGTADGLGLVETEALALQLAPLRLPAGASEVENEPLVADLGLADLLKLGDPHAFDPATAWAPRTNRQRLRVPIGIGTDGRPLELDFKESAQDGMGPHGLLIGATGSGKSELLRTLVLALATTHDSTTLNFVLVDFKGGATFTKLDQLPHTSAVITNLADELPLVDRMTDAINGELIRRQELLRAAGNFSSQRDYEQARRAGAALAPLPSLLVIVDEFSELLTAKPDFIDMFVQIGRVGRSLGVHLLLASQRLEEGRLRGLDTHLSYRIGLRTFSGSESKAVLGVADAYRLPHSPGHGFLKAGTDELTRFKAAYVSGVHQSAAALPRPSVAQAVAHVREYTTAYTPTPATPELPEPAEVSAEESSATGETLLDILVERLAGKGDPAHQVWLPPLGDPPPLDQLLPPLAADPARGLSVTDPRMAGRLGVPVGLLDRPLEQRRDPLWLDLSAAGGHVLVVGGPHSGKSTLLRSIVSSLALTHTPREVQCYCLDFGGGSLVGLRNLPHVGGVATRRDVSQVRRTIAELQLLLATREQWFGRHAVESMASYRQRRRAGELAEDPYGDVFLVVDGWATIRSEFEDLADSLVALANRGLSFGIHIVASANRWMDVRHTVKDMFGTKLELRLGDPADSMLGRRAAMNVPEHAPGRGVTSDGLQFLAAVPRIDGRTSDKDLAEGTGALVAAVRRGWEGPGAPAVRQLPAEVPYDRIPTGDGPALPIGIAETDLRPVHLDFRTDPHFLVFGASECGKSSFLRALARRIVERHEPTEARLVIVDYRRSLLGAVTTDHQIGYGSSAKATTGIIQDVAKAMTARLPGPDVTPQQLRERSWWTGPELFVLVDDYDLVTSAAPNPLQPLLEFLPQARDIGLHLVLVRRSGGASRAMFEQLIRQLKELDSPGLVMSGSRDEGKLLGDVRPSALPPGRGWLVTRGHGARLVQLAHLPPDDERHDRPRGDDDGRHRPTRAPADVRRSDRLRRVQRGPILGGRRPTENQRRS